jgi:hypothetical protein
LSVVIFDDGEQEVAEGRDRRAAGKEVNDARVVEFFDEETGGAQRIRQLEVIEFIKEGRGGVLQVAPESVTGFLGAVVILG